MVSLIFKPFIFLFQFLNRTYWSGLNNKSIFNLILQFCIGFSPIFIWLLIFKNAGIIPNNIRPPIHVKLPYHLDTYMFQSIIGSFLTLLCLFFISMLLYFSLYQLKSKPNYHKYPNINHHYNKNSENIFNDEEIEESSNSSSSSSSSFDIELQSFDFEQQEISPMAIDSPPSNFQNNFNQSFTFLRQLTNDEVSTMAMKINEKIITKKINHPLNSWYLTPPIMVFASWFILNLDYFVLKDPILVWKDLLAWTSYVLGHITVPILTSVWLYIFHEPGAIKSYGFALGLQNICGVLTHLLFPCAPPWFIHLYGEDKVGTYDMKGYAAGLTRVDIHLGTHLNSKGFHASPIVFGAIPSLHSAMAVMTLYFISYFARSRVLKLSSFFFVVLQWWATIYLDHHWRLDLLVGLVYATFWFTLIKKVLIDRYNKEFIDSRLNYDFENGSTMGMRVFRNTNLQRFFDPLA